QTRPDIVVEHEKLEFAPELSMVALLRFLEHRKVIIKFLPGFEGCAVNALELRILFVAFVVRASNAGELKRADVSGAHDVRPRAEVDELPVAIERDFFVRRNVVDNIELEFARFRALAKR